MDKNKSWVGRWKATVLSAVGEFIHVRVSKTNHSSGMCTLVAGDFQLFLLMEGLVINFFISFGCINSQKMDCSEI